MAGLEVAATVVVAVLLLFEGHEVLENRIHEFQLTVG